MRNAKKYDDKITIGVVPDYFDLKQIKGLGYGILVDLRASDEKFGGLVAEQARKIGLKYIEIEVSREAIRDEDVIDFFNVIFNKDPTPIYAFSRFGKKPLAFLLILEAVKSDNSIQHLYRKANEFGLSLEGDISIQEFLIRLLNEGKCGPFYEKLRRQRPDLLESALPPEDQGQKTSVERKPVTDSVLDTLMDMLSQWKLYHDKTAMRSSISKLMKQLDYPIDGDLDGSEWVSLNSK